MNDSWPSAMGGGYGRGGVMGCVFFILLLPALYITVSLSEKCHTRVCLQKKAKKNTEMEKKRKWSLVMSGLKNSEEHRANERPLAVSGACVCVCKLCTSKSHAMSTSAANWPSDAMSSRTNRTGREPDRTGQQGQQRHASGARAPVTWRAFPFPSPCPALPCSVLAVCPTVFSLTGWDRMTRILHFYGLMSASLITIFIWE